MKNFTSYTTPWPICHVCKCSRPKDAVMKAGEFDGKDLLKCKDEQVCKQLKESVNVWRK